MNPANAATSGRARLLVPMLFVLMHFGVSAQNITLTEIVTTDTANPGYVPPGLGTGTFENFYQYSLDGDDLWFVASIDYGGGSSSGGNLYLGDGGPVSEIVDAGVAHPDGVGIFSSTERVSAQSGTATFSARGFGGSEPWGIYQYDGVQITKILTQSTQLPGSSQTFVEYRMVAMEDDAFAFIGRAFGPNIDGIYHYQNSVLTTIADSTMMLPGGGDTYGAFDLNNLQLAGGHASFLRRNPMDNKFTLYEWDSVQVNRVAGPGDPVPGMAETFDDVPYYGHGQNAFGDQKLAYVGLWNTNHYGLFKSENGATDLIAQTTQQVPGEVDDFFAVFHPATGPLGTAFRGLWLDSSNGNAQVYGIYFEHAGEVFKVLDSRDMIGGLPYTTNGISNTSLSGNQLAVLLLDSNSGRIALVRAEIEIDADLSLDKRGCHKKVRPGQTIHYRLSVKNQGAFSATGVTLTDALPADFNFVSSTPAGLCNANAGTVTCQLPNLAAAGATDLSIEVQVDPGASSGPRINSASVSSAEVDPSAGNNTDSDGTTVDGGLVFAGGMEQCRV